MHNSVFPWLYIKWWIFITIRWYIDLFGWRYDCNEISIRFCSLRLRWCNIKCPSNTIIYIYINSRKTTYDMTILCIIYSRHIFFRIRTQPGSPLSWRLWSARKPETCMQSYIIATVSSMQYMFKQKFFTNTKQAISLCFIRAAVWNLKQCHTADLWSFSLLPAMTCLDALKAAVHVNGNVDADELC